jgi:tetratricopeptide (TPR) repeat protein
MAHALLLLAMGTAPSFAQAGAHDGGRVHFAISCSAAAQAQFDRAVTLLHHMTYAQARSGFEQAAATDPACAMAHWGYAMTLFQPLWPTRPSLADRRLGFEQVGKAQALEVSSERERLFIEAAAAFFAEPDSPDYWARIGRWEQAMAKVYAADPADDEAATFYALAHLAAAPPDQATHVNNDEAAAILQTVLARHPDHPGATHYLVHANDVAGREHDSLDVVRGYEAVAPHNPHALHMPTHIFTRLGDWDGVIRGNLRAADAALHFPAGPKGDRVWDEFAHAIEYLTYAYLQQGADADAARQVARLRATPNLEPTFKTAFHLASTASRYALERHAWDDAAKLVPRTPAALDWDGFPWPEAIARFAQGLGSAHLGQLDDARRAATRIGELEDAATRSGEKSFARNIHVLRMELDAWIAHAAGRAEDGVAALREAADLEAATPKPPVTPAPTVPAYELLGDMLLEQKQTAAALAAYRKSLESYPRRFNRLAGAARAAHALGDDAATPQACKELLEVAAKTSRRPVLGDARSWLAKSG